MNSNGISSAALEFVCVCVCVKVTHASWLELESYGGEKARAESISARYEFILESGRHPRPIHTRRRALVVMNRNHQIPSLPPPRSGSLPAKKQLNTKSDFALFRRQIQFSLGKTGRHSSKCWRFVFARLQLRQSYFGTGESSKQTIGPDDERSSFVLEDWRVAYFTQHLHTDRHHTRRRTDGRTDRQTYSHMNTNKHSTDH
jgi:hypothetical protein